MTAVDALVHAVTAAAAPLWQLLAGEVVALVPEGVYRVRVDTIGWPIVTAFAETAAGEPVDLDRPVDAAVDAWCQRRAHALRMLAATDDAGSVWLDRADATTQQVVEEVCGLCGCTDAAACPGSCWWIAPGICSSHDVADAMVLPPIRELFDPPDTHDFHRCCAGLPLFHCTTPGGQDRWLKLVDIRDVVPAGVS